MESKIKAEEIKVGNKITDIPYGRELEVIEIRKNGVGCHYKGQQNTEIDGVRYSHFAYEDLTGIPLTPELLEKAGFMKMKSDKHTSYTGVAQLNYGNPVLWLNEHSKLSTNGGNDYLFMGDGFRIPCKYLHQLQNLYYCLTSSELKIEI